MLRAAGWLCAITEKYNPFAKVRQDLFGFIDILCVKGDEVLAIQTTSGSNVAARIEKIHGLQAAKLWLESPHRRIVVHGWKKSGARGERKIWNCRQVEVFATESQNPHEA